MPHAIPFLLQKRRTLRESNKKLKSNGYNRGSMASSGGNSGGALVHTPESVTLSVGSLTQRQIFPSGSSNPWQRTNPSMENLDPNYLPPPPVYQEPTVSESLLLAKHDLIIGMYVSISR
jgi:hypothetical protein